MGHVDVAGVRYELPDGRVLLDDVSFRVGEGAKVALVGANGAGKTTIVKLLCRLYDPDGGRITIDGVDLRDFRPEELRREISVVFQDFMHYQVSARENIWFGDVSRSAEDADIIQAATMAGADSVLRKLPQGYQTILGNLFQDAEELSVGEWQKVAIARAFFNEAQLLVVDEPTSALDALAEAELFEKLRTLVAGRATLLISHRFSTVRMADRIYVIEGGKVLETGSHDELMLRGGKYASLFRIQAAPYRETETSIAPSPDA
jgi:ATP-binding cassette subfamily B protein